MLIAKLLNLRELVTSTTVILAPGACGKGVRKRSQVPISGESGESGESPGMPDEFREAQSDECTGATLLASWAEK